MFFLSPPPRPPPPPSPPPTSWKHSTSNIHTAMHVFNAYMFWGLMYSTNCLSSLVNINITAEKPFHLLNILFKCLTIKHRTCQVKRGEKQTRPDETQMTAMIYCKYSKQVFNSDFLTAPDKVLFSSEKYQYLSYFCMKTYVVGTH